MRPIRGINQYTGGYPVLTPNSVAAGTTTYAAIRSMMEFNATEATNWYYTNFPCTISRMVVKTGSTQPNTGTLTYTLRNNAVDTNMRLVISANAAAGVYYTDTLPPFFVPAKSKLSVKTVNAASSTSATISSGGVHFGGTSPRYTRPRFMICGAGASSGQPLNTTYYWFINSYSNQTTESTRQGIFGRGGIIKHLVVTTAGAQPSTGSLTITFRKNGAATNVLVVIAANAAAGTYNSGDVYDTFKSEDLVCWQSVNAASSTSARVFTFAAYIYE